MLTVKDLTFAFKNRPLFHNISFEVGSGMLLRLAGAHGSGKSTLLSLISGLMSGATGSIKFEGPDDFRSWTSWIAPDANGLTPTLPATKNIGFWMELRQIPTDPDLIHETLNRWGLTGEWIQSSLPVSKFSTGMKRRLALVRLELEGTKLWLLDEPLFGLDDAACKQFRETLRKHLSAGGAAVVVTHDERVLEGIPHRTITLGEAAV
jgi:heme exporter protein A